MPAARAIRWLGALLVATAVATPSSGLAHAHAELVDTEPANGAQLSSSPDSIVLHFTEPVEALDGAIEVLDSNGTDVEIGDAVSDTTTVSATLPLLADGGYVVNWQVVSSDGHPIAGALTFAVGEAMPPAQPDGAGTSAGDKDGLLLSVLRGLITAGLAIVLGAWAFVILCAPGRHHGRMLTAVVVIGAAVATFASIARLPVEADVLGIGVADTWDLRSGRAWWTLVGISLVSFAVEPLIASRVRREVHVATWIVAAAAAGVALAFAGHGASGRWTPLGTSMTVVHVAAVSVWIGGLVTLVAVLRRAKGTEAASLATRFSSVATVALAAVVASGVIQAIRQVDPLDAIFDSDFGRTLVVKLVVVATVVAVALTARRIVRRGGGVRAEVEAMGRLRTAVGVEAVVGIAVFGVTGWLAGSSPTPDADAVPVEQRRSVTTDDGAATVSVSPGIAGDNRIEVTAVGPDGGTPADDIALRLTNTDAGVGTLEIDTVPAGAGTEVADLAVIPYAGRWTATIEARFGEFDVAEFTVDLDID